MTIRKFIEQFKEVDKSSNPGDEYRTIYKLVVEDGKEELVPDDMVRIDDEIQSHEPSVNIGNILARYSLGDTDAINKVKGFYGDVSDLSKNFAEYLNLDMEAQRLFSQLPVDIRNLFGDDYRMLILEPERIKEMYKHDEVKEVIKEVGEVNDDQEH